jgi:hypothetical protein
LDVLKIPIIPFGSIVVAHIPLQLQTKSGPRSTLTYCVGSASDYKGGLLLFNPITHRVIVRRTFKVLGPQLPLSPSIHSINSLDLDPTVLSSTRDISTTATQSPLFMVSGEFDSSIPASIPDMLPSMPLDTIKAQNNSIPLLAASPFDAPLLKRKLSRAQRIAQRNEEWYNSASDPLPAPLVSVYQKSYTTTSSDRTTRSLNRPLVGALALGMALFANVSSTISYHDRSVPRNYELALLGSESAHWIGALRSEVTSLKSMGVWNPNEYIDIKSFDKN